LTLLTNQYFHGGVWGKLHNLSVRPRVTIGSPVVNNNTLSFTVFRDKGPDVYGSFLIRVTLKDGAGNIVLQPDMKDLSRLPAAQIENAFVAKVKLGRHA